MKKNEVTVGQTYLAKVTNKVVPVRIDRENPEGGWDATNTATNKKVRIKSAQRLRGPADRHPANPDRKRQPVKKKLSKKDRDALRAQHKADQENARLRDERAASPDGQTASERAIAKSPKGRKAAKPKKLSLIDAAAKVLADAGEPMNAKQMVEAVTEQGLWTPGAGKTPHATLYAAISREIQKKGADARFTKVERGQFTVAKGA